MTPIIGVTHCRALTDYLESVSRVSGEPRVFDCGKDAPAAAIRGVHGLLLTGGGDVDPSRYGEASHATASDLDPDRDDYEIALVRQAVEADIPILGICRGMQVINVALGGTLIQDVPSEVAGVVEHAIKEPRFAIAHEVWIAPSSLLWSLMRDKLAEGEACQVNSRHHQALKKVAEGFEVSATAPDGVIEAIERRTSRFCVGVQWHPENFWRTGEFRPLFEAFVTACSESRR